MCVITVQKTAVLSNNCCLRRVTYQANIKSFDDVSKLYIGSTKENSKQDIMSTRLHFPRITKINQKTTLNWQITYGF